MKFTHDVCFVVVWILSLIVGMSIKSDIDLFFYRLSLPLPGFQTRPVGDWSALWWRLISILICLCVSSSSSAFLLPHRPLPLSTPGFHLTPFSSCPRRLFVYWLVCPDDGGPIKDATPDLASVRIREHSADVDEDK